MGHMTDNMNDFQHTELNSLKTKNSGGGGWLLQEFGHMMRGENAIVRCVRYHPEKQVRHTIEYEIDPKGRSSKILDAEGPVA